MPVFALPKADLKFYFGCKPILERKVKILYLQGFRAFNGCKPILTITEERRTRELRIQGLNNYTGIAERKPQPLCRQESSWEMLADGDSSSARYPAKQAVSEWVQRLSPFRLERMMAGVCRTMKSKNNVPKLHGGEEEGCQQGDASPLIPIGGDGGLSEISGKDKGV